MNGITVSLESTPPVSPVLATPPQVRRAQSHASRSPPTASTAPAHVAFSSGLVPRSSVVRDSDLARAEPAQVVVLIVLAGDRHDL